MKYMGRDIDFSAPLGEPALSAPDSVAWRIFKNPASLFIGGVTAVILELAEPRVRSGVWDHSSFRKDPLARMKRTGLAAMITVYGPGSTAKAVIEGVNRMHARVAGETPDGEPYRANDPELLAWVQATASYGFLEAYHAFVSPLPDAEKNRFYAEQTPAAELYGAARVPRSLAERRAFFDDWLKRLEPSDIIFEFIDIMRATAVLPGPLRVLQRPFIRAAVSILPENVRDRLGLGEAYGLRRFEGGAIRRAAQVADRVPVPGSPPVLACRRMGLSGAYLHLGGGAALDRAA
ncbi:MAG: oxygenase MpaB family protein [Pseudomonadota bacterium]